MRPTDAYYTVRPRAQGSTFRMSTAGSSVLLSLGSPVLGPAEAVQRRDSAGSPTQEHAASAGTGAQTARDHLGRGGDRVPLVDLSIIEKAASTLPSVRESRSVQC